MKLPKKFTFMLLIAALFIPVSSCAASLTSALESLVQKANLGDTHVAIRVVDLQSGQVLASGNSSESMLPASNTKLVTVAAALDTFGKDFVYKTKLNLIRQGSKNSSFNNKKTLPDLVVVGAGDPAFGDPVLLKKYGYTTKDLLNQWVGAVVKTNITHFHTLFIDDRIFDRNFIYYNWPRHQLIRDYCAQVAGIDFHLNCLSITPVPAREKGAAATIKIFPKVPFIPRTNTTTTKKGGYFVMDRKLNTNHLIFTGHVSRKPKKPYLITVDDPPMVFGRILKYQLKQAGVEVDKVLRAPAHEKLPASKTLAVVNTSLPLVLARCAQDSQNLYAESMFKRLGYVLTGNPGSWKNGAKGINKFLQKQIGKLSLEFHIVDGSGMSRSNRVTARGLVALLKSMYDSKNLRKTYIHSLSHAGINGTLKYRLENLNNVKVFAKSGYLRSVSALSGYILPDNNSSGHAIAFSFIFNGFKPPVYNSRLKRLQDKMVKLIIRQQS